MAQFPVSSGKQHQLVENTWVPVTTSTVATTSSTTISTTASSSVSKEVVTLQKQMQEQLPEHVKPKPLPPPPAPPLNPVLSRPYDWKSDDHYCKTIFPTLAPPPEVIFVVYKLNVKYFMWILYYYFPASMRCFRNYFTATKCDEETSRESTRC